MFVQSCGVSSATMTGTVLTWIPQIIIPYIDRCMPIGQAHQREKARDTVRAKCLTLCFIIYNIIGVEGSRIDRTVLHVRMLQSHRRR